MKTPISYYGGKLNMIIHILPLIPQHDVYVEPFLGGGAVFFAKGKSKTEVINDVNNHVINFFEVVRDNFDELQAKIQQTYHSRELHRQANEIYKKPAGNTRVMRAWAFWYSTNGSFAHKPGAGWAYSNNNHKNSSEAHTIAFKRENFTKKYHERVKNVFIENNDALKVIESRDTTKTFFYLDPPYINSDCGHYNKEKGVFNRLLEVLPRLKGKFMLSSYPHPELTKLTIKHNWKTKGINAKVTLNNSNKKHKNKTELLVCNYSPIPTLFDL